MSTKYEKNTNLRIAKKGIDYYKSAFRKIAYRSSAFVKQQAGKQAGLYIAGIMMFFLLNTSCKKEKEKIYDYVYEVNDVNVNQAGVNKPNVKSTVEFISIAYSDLFGTTIDQVNLTNLSLAYVAFGDKKFVEDMIIRNFLNKTGVIIPTKAEMTADVSAFVKATYRKFYNREPNEFEKWQVVNYINSDSNVTPELVYYSFMTSDEYRYY